MSKRPIAASLTSVPLDPVEEDHAPRVEQYQAGVEAPPPDTGTKALTLRIPPALHEELRQKAFKRRRTIHSLILEALMKDGYQFAKPD